MVRLRSRDLLEKDNLCWMRSSPVLHSFQTSFRRLVKTILVEEVRTNIKRPEDVATIAVLVGLEILASSYKFQLHLYKN